MSESSISTSLTAPYGLFTQAELMTCSMFNFKILLLAITILIVISSLMLIINLMMNDNLTKKEKNTEDFGNNQFFSYRDTINPGYFWAQSAQLTPEGDFDEMPLISGQASKIITKDVTDTIGTKVIFYLDLYCSLYVLYGNPFGEIQANSTEILSQIEQGPSAVNQHYLVYLVDKTGKKLYIDKLYKESDGIYKLKFKDPNFEKYVNFNKVLVTYIIGDKETPLLSGNFTIS
jgi:hypothetical protein